MLHDALAFGGRGLLVMERIALLLAPPVLRIALALPFIRSALTRWDGLLVLSPATTFLFENLFKLHVFGLELPIPFPALTAWVVALAEVVLPAMLIFGFGTRLAALGLLAMTAVIQLVVPDGWANFHLYWAALALAIMAIGPGAISLDRVFARQARAGRHELGART